MKRSKSDKSARVYKFGSPLKTAVESEVAMEQLRLQNRFWNALVEADKVFTEKYWAIRDGADARLPVLRKQIEDIKVRTEEIRTEIKKGRQDGIKGTPSDLKAEIVELKAQKKPLIAEKKEIWAFVKDTVKPQLHELDGERYDKNVAIRQEYAQNGLYWGNYLAVMDSFETARMAIMKTQVEDGQKRPELQFHRFERVGRWTCQIQGGMNITQAFLGSNNYFQIDRLPADAWTHPSRGERGRLKRTKARIRIGSGEKKTVPIWLEIPIVMHRPIPESAEIKSVSIHVSKLADKFVWSLTVTVREDCSVPLERTGHCVAINIGWRAKGLATRIAYMLDSRGVEEEILLGSEYTVSNEKAASLQGIRKKNFNETVAWFNEWKKANADIVPPWLSERTKMMMSWKSEAQLASVAIQWSGRGFRREGDPPEFRFHGDEEAFNKIEAWRKQDKHLWQWHANLSDRIRGRRLCEYRKIALKLSKEYDVVIQEDFDLRKTKGKKKAEEGADNDDHIRRMSDLASVSTFRTETIRAMRSAGKEHVKLDSKNITKTCPFCGGTIKPGRKTNIMVQCSKCGKVYDQDWAASKNLLTAYLDSSGDVPPETP